MSQKEIDILKRALQREKLARKESEKILEEKSRILYDTTQKLEVLLLEKSTQLKGVFENIVDAYVVMDINGNILKFNDAATELFGHNIIKEHLNVKELVYKDDLEYAFASFLELTKVGFFKNYEARIYTKFKGVRWVHINASVIYDKDKNPIAAQGIVRDVSSGSEMSATCNHCGDFGSLDSGDTSAMCNCIYQPVDYKKNDTINDLLGRKRKKISRRERSIRQPTNRSDRN